MNIQEYSKKFQHFSAHLDVRFHLNRSIIRYLYAGKTSKNLGNQPKYILHCTKISCKNLRHESFSIFCYLILSILLLSPEYWNCLPPLTEIETEQTEPPTCINFSSFLDETVCSVPDLEEIPNPDSTDYPSFLGQNYENRDCTRVLRSNVSKSSFHPLHSM